jgi:Family of unknown function (DUF6263)
MNRAQVRILHIGLLALLLAGNAAPAQEVVRYKFQPAEKLRYELEQKMIMDMNVQGNAISIEMTQTIDVVWDIKSVDKDGKAKMTQTFERVRMSMIGPMGTVDYDSRNGKMPEGPVGEAMGPLFKAMAGLVLGVSMDARGQIGDVEVPKEFLDAIKNSPAAAASGDMFSQDGMKRMISQSGLVLPGGALTKGQSWDTKMDMKMPFGKMLVVNNITSEGTGTRDGLKIEQFAIKPKITLEPDANSPATVTLNSQDTKGTAYFDPAAGRLVEMNITQKMDMDVAVMGQNIKEKIEQKVTYKLAGKEKDK